MSEKLEETDTLEDRCERFLAMQKCTLWADWVISDPGRRRVAAQWLADQIRGVQRVNHPVIPPVSRTAIPRTDAAALARAEEQRVREQYQEAGIIDGGYR